MKIIVILILLFDNLKEAEKIIQPEIWINELYSSIDKFRWFILYKDVKEKIQTLNNNEFTVLIPQIEEKRNRIEESVILKIKIKKKK